MSSEKRYNKNHHPVMRAVIYAVTALIAFVFVILAVWSFNTLWVFPDLIPDTWSLDGYISVLGDKAFGQTVLTSFGITITVCLAAVVVATLVARAFVFYDFAGKDLLEFLVYLPCIVPAVTLAIGINIIFIGFDLDGTFLGVVIPQIAISMPYAIKIITDATRLLGNKYEEQAVVLGSSPLKAYFQVSLFYMLPSIISAACMVFTVSFNDYFLTFLLGKGQISTFAVMLVPLINGSNMSKAAVSGLIYVAVAMLFFFVMEQLSNFILKKQRLYLG